MLQIEDIVTNTIANMYEQSALTIDRLAYDQVRAVTDAARFDTGFIDPIVRALKDIAFVLVVVFGFLLFYAVWKLIEVQRAANTAQVPSPDDVPAPAPGGPFVAKWGEVMRHMDSAKEAEWKFAVIEADKLVQDALHRGQFPGDTMGEKLMNIQSGTLISLEGLWEAHKVRNRIAHDLDYFLRYSEAKKAIEQFEATLRELGAI